MQDDDNVAVVEPTLEEKLDNLDDDLNPINEEVREDDAKGNRDGANRDKEVEQSGSTGDESSDESTEENKDSTDDEGYTIDEGNEEPDEVVSNSTKETKTENLTPENKYILDNISPITVRGVVGDGEVKEYQVLSPEALPSGFKYVDDREASSANKSFNLLEQKALQLQADYRGQQTNKATQEFKEREDRADRQDIATLQKEGKIPRFKAQPSSADFDKDPGVQFVQEVIDFKEAQNQKYMDEYNAGRPYKHIGFDEAFRMYQRDNPTNPAQAKEDSERLNMARRTSKTNGTSTKPDLTKSRAHTGMTGMDLDTLIESKTAGW